MSRPRKPSHLIQGHRNRLELQHREQVERELAALDSDLKFLPFELEHDELAQQYYWYLLSNLMAVKIPVSNLDIPLLVECADALARLHECRIDIAKYGMWEDKYDKNGNIVGTQQRAPVKVKDSYSKLYNSIAAKLGLDPSSRAVIASASVEDIKMKVDESYDLFD